MGCHGIYLSEDLKNEITIVRNFGHFFKIKKNSE